LIVDISRESRIVGVVASTSPLRDLPGLTGDLGRVETELLAVARADDDFLTEVASHLIKAGGKRQRPAFAIAASLAEGGSLPASSDVVSVAVASELVHLGSLYHDDVMDDATTRRTVESVNAKWGNLKAILAGDFLLAKASEIAAGLGTEVAGLMAATIGRLCEGQVRELQDIYNLERRLPDYVSSISGKTAALFATACRSGAIVGGLSRDNIEALTTFGHEYGMAFQIVDDILDLVATEAELGKPAGNDLVEGVYTLPVLHALTDGSGNALRDILGKPLEGDERDKARSIVRDSGAIEWSLDHARQHAGRAKQALAPVADTVGGGCLSATADWLIDSVTIKV
jgi:heptaprenyl diphosphate synthase